uniref:GPR158/179 extracellular domain-containing protein n=1 Tax=Salarias fasciatus TaxID=181472 RepID=A0A672G9X9_SALFA
MGPALLLLLLLPAPLGGQLTPDPPSAVSVDLSNSSFTNRTSEVSNSSVSWSGPAPSGSPSGPPTEPEEDDWSPAEAFLYTGDASALRAARCSRAYGAAGRTGPLPRGFAAALRPALDALANTANFLNMVFQASDLRESTVQEDMEWYHAVVRALLEADRLVQRALLTFDADPAAPAPQLVLRASRGPAARARTVVLQDLSFKFPEPGRPAAALSKRVLLNDLDTLDTPKWGQGDSYVTNRSGVRWSGGPFLDCADQRFVPRWMLTLSTSFYGLKPDLTPEFRGVVRVDVDIQDIDLDQCAAGSGWFADSHQCNRTTMEVNKPALLDAPPSPDPHHP